MEKITLKEIEWPEFGVPEGPVLPPSAAELKSRLKKCREIMKERQLTHLVVYGDREHFANMMYLTYFDPRFEEAILILNTQDDPLLVVGNECVGHVPVSPLYQEEALRMELYQPFSLLNQPRDTSRTLTTILSSEGIDSSSRVGCIGWKYFTPQEFGQPEQMIDLPAFIVDTLRTLTDSVVNATDILMSSAYGMRSSCSVYEIAFFERSTVMASEGMKNLFRNFREGMTDFDMIRYYQFNGFPLSSHISFKSSGNQHYGLTSPVGSPLVKGQPCSSNMGYWGSNMSRAGWLAYDEEDLPEEAKDYVEAYAAPYFFACSEWYRYMKIGTKGKELYQLMTDLLPFEHFQVSLNPGHLSHYDEWLSSPVYKDSEEEIRSGMYMQVDIIPRSKTYFSSRMEEGIIIADRSLREQLATTYPDVYARCMSRRQFMENTLGFILPEEILPLSNMPGIVPPYFYSYKKILTINR